MYMSSKKEGVCDKCKTSMGYLRIKQNEWVCRRCGKITHVSNIELPPTEESENTNNAQRESDSI
jgi:ribosomal protein L37AE/L43A